MERCVAGSPSVVLVGGEAGVGKSRLLAELAARAADEDVVRVLRGQCADLEEAAIPLLAVVNAVRDLVDDEIDLRPRSTGRARGTRPPPPRACTRWCSIASPASRGPSCSWSRTSTGPTAPRWTCSPSSRGACARSAS